MTADDDRLNYSTQAIDELKKHAKMLDQIRMPVAAAITRKLADDLLRAVKFVLPDNGSIIYGERAGTVPHMDLFRLPFPITVVEYEALKQSASTDEYGVDIIPVPRRMAIAYDLSFESILNEWRETIPVSGYGINRPDVNGTLIWPINDISGSKDYKEMPEMGLWAPNWCAAVIPVDTRAIMRKVDTMQEDVKKLFIATHPGIKETGYYEFKPVWCGEVGLLTKNEFDALNCTNAMIMRDLDDEVTAVTELGIALSCKNVRRVVLEAPKKLNLKRVRNGKTPFFDYHILTLDIQSKGGASSTGTMEQSIRNSPRTHLRRGHIRRLDNEAVWINSTVVNFGKGNGFSDKEYRVNGEKS